MARQRFIWPDIWSDPHVAHLPTDAMLLFIGCFSNADDVGRLLADPAYLKGTIFPYQKFGVEYVLELRTTVVEHCPTVELYLVDGVEYLAFRRWKDHQKPKYPKPSKLPAPPKPKRRKPAPSDEQSRGNDSGNHSGDSEESFRRNAETIPPWVGLGRDGLGEPSSLPPSVVEEPARATDADIPLDLAPADRRWSTADDMQTIGELLTVEEGRRP